MVSGGLVVVLIHGGCGDEVLGCVFLAQGGGELVLLLFLR